MTRLFTLLFTFLLISNFSHSQNRVDYERDTKWNFGINAGGTWQEKELDLVSKAGFSGGFTFGRAIYEKEGRLLSFDLRARFLWGSSKGWGTTLSYDSLLFGSHNGGVGYKNYKFTYGEAGLELVVNAHRLRERTGILLYGFGGINSVNYSVKHNYQNAQGFYNYTLVNSAGTPTQIVEDLTTNYNDFNWETENKYFSGFRSQTMPSLGIGLGYQISPKFSMGIEHKITFALNDELNGFKDGRNDYFHYTNLNFRWNLFRGNNKGEDTYVPDNRPINNNAGTPTSTNDGSSNGGIDDYSTQTPQGKKPLVNITQPSVNGTTVFAPSYNVQAKVYNVGGKNDISFLHNGISITNFNYNSNTHILNTTVNLQQGANTFVITATNSFGSDSDSKTINLERKCDRPAIVVTKPMSSQIVVQNSNSVIKAKITNIQSSSNIIFKHNGVVSQQFSYNNYTKAFVANVVCNVGTNVFEITATNNCGTVTKTRTIVYNKKVINTSPPPIVTITNPATSPKVVSSSSFVVGATVLNIQNRNQIQFKINGILNNSFTYNPTTKVFSATINVQNGNNIIEITATNTVGTDSKSAILKKKEVQQSPPPLVTFIAPSQTPYNTTQNIFVVKAKVLYVNQANQIEVRLNGQIIQGVNFNPITKEIIFSVNLIQGANAISVKGTNQAGVDQKTTTIVYNRVVPQLPPEVTITQPSSSPFNVTNSVAVVNGYVQYVNSRSQITVLVNGVNFSNFTYDTNTKAIHFTLNLIQGANTVKIIASNNYGTDTESVIIVYHKPTTIEPPVVAITNPSVSPYTTTNGTEQIVATVLNVANASQITVKQNGVLIPNFSYNTTTRVLSFIANLITGTNTFVITATNTAGIANANQKIIYNQPCIPPTINLVIPASSPHNHVGRNGNMAFTINTTNITNNDAITLTNNGYAVPFTLRSSDGDVWGTVPLQVGANTLKLTVSNACGQATREINILYKGNTGKLRPPEITIQSPNSFPHTITNDNITILGKVLYAASQNDITVTKNGNAIPFTYNTATKALTIPLNNLSVGSHQIRVRAHNNTGNDMEVFDIIRTGTPIKQPKVTFANLGTHTYRNPVKVSRTNYSVKGKVINTKNTTVKIYVRGRQVSNYSYNAKTGLFSIPVTFSSYEKENERPIEVKVVASNSAGVGEKSIYVAYHSATVTRPTAPKNVKPQPTKPSTRPASSTKPSVKPNNNAIKIDKSAKQYQDYCNKGDNLVKQGKLKEAKEWYEKALRLRPNERYPKEKLKEIENKLKEKVQKTSTPKRVEKYTTKPIVKP